MNINRISVASDFSRHPGGRFRSDGEFSGEQFRDDLLIPAVNAALQGRGKVVVVLDGVDAYASSFLEEVFGGLVRANVAPYAVLKDVVQIISEDPLYDIYARLANECLRDAAGGAQPRPSSKPGGFLTARAG